LSALDLLLERGAIAREMPIFGISTQNVGMTAFSSLEFRAKPATALADFPAESPSAL
jgi:hypothetical protein